MTDTKSPLLNTCQVAAMLGLKKSTIEKWRVTNRGPAFIRIGGAIRYRQSVVNAWMQAQTVTPDNAA